NQRAAAPLPAVDRKPRVVESADEADALARCAVRAGDEIKAVERPELALDRRGRLQRVGAAERRGADRDLARGIAEATGLGARAVDLDRQARTRSLVVAGTP